MGTRDLLKAGYSIKHTDAVGWWVDGLCGFLVAGYFSTKRKAVRKASDAINAAQDGKTHPVWLFS